MTRTLVGACAALAISAALTGCGVPSLHPVYSEEHAVRDDRVLGVWATHDDHRLEATFSVSPRDEGGYRVEYTQRQEDQARMSEADLRLFRLGDSLFAEFSAPEHAREEIAQGLGMTMVPAFVTYHLQLAEGSAHLRTFNPERLRGQLLDDPDLTPHALGDEFIVLTGSTAELQAFYAARVQELLEHGDHVHLVRVADRPRHPDAGE